MSSSAYPGPPVNGTAPLVRVTSASSGADGDSATPISASSSSNSLVDNSTSSRRSHRLSLGTSSIRSKLASVMPSRNSKYPPSVSSTSSGRLDGRPTSAYSGDGSEEEDEDLEEDYDNDDTENTEIPFAGSKRNAEFHEVFPEVEDDDHLAEDYGAALQREILIQGRLYVSANNFCFHANIFGWVTHVVIPVEDVVSIEKRMTAKIIPNAITVTTSAGDKYTFASLLSRDTTYDVMRNILRGNKPDLDGIPASMRESSIMEDSRGEEDAAADEYNGAMGMDTGPANDEASNPLLASVQDNPTELLTPVGEEASDNVAPPPPSTKAADFAAAHRRKQRASKRTPAKAHRVTQCACSKKNEHFPEVAREYTVPGTPESIYNLMFTSGFVKDFMVNEQGLKDLQISDWKPEKAGSNLLYRNMSYIKPLIGSFGPKETKCELRDDTLHADFDDYVSTMTTTRTPNVPSGGVFSVKTRTCLMWAGPASTKVIVTTKVDWTGRSFVKSIIDKMSMEGQKTYHADLEKAMRAYIKEHRGEFVKDGQDEHLATMEGDGTATGTAEASSDSVRAKEARPPKSSLGMQWGLDTVTSTFDMGKQSFWGSIDLLGDLFQNLSWTTLLALIVFGLMVSNSWMLYRLSQALGVLDGYKATSSRATEAVAVPREQAWPDDLTARVASEAAQLFWEETVKRAPSHLPPSDNPREEVDALQRTLAYVERQVIAMKGLVNDLD